MFCFVLTSPPLMLCVYLQTFEAALFWKKKKKMYSENSTDLKKFMYLCWYAAGIKIGIGVSGEEEGIGVGVTEMHNFSMLLVQTVCSSS